MSKRSDTDSPSYDRNHLADVPLTRSIAQIARNIQLTALTSTVVERCKHSVLDWLGVTIAGAQEPAARLVREVMIDDTSSGFTTVIGCSGLQAGLLNGVTANGTASHALDFDDIMPSTGPGHPTAPVLPALVALAERDDMSGASVLAAYLAALETEARLSLLVWPGHYRAGWHTTATIGTFGAAAGCAHLLGLDLDTWQVTLGIAGTQAAGLRLMFGTMCKPFHVGKAASNGLLAALLAKRGFTSNPDVLEAEQGFCWTQSDTLDLEDALDPTQSGLAVNEVIFKRHAACFGTHSCIDAIQRLRRDHGFQANDIAEVGIQASDDILSMCNIAVPQTGLEGKFSLRFTAALALAGADTSHLSFTDAAVTDPRFISLRDKVTVVASDESDQTTRVRITLKNGQSLTAEGDLYKPAGDDELADQWETLVTKFCGLSIPVIGESTTKHIVEVITHLDEIESMRELTRLL